MSKQSAQVSHEVITHQCIQAQQTLVKRLYTKTNSCNPDYEREFSRLSQMRRIQMAVQYRLDKGLSVKAKTPYC